MRTNEVKKIIIDRANKVMLKDSKESIKDKLPFKTCYNINLDDKKKKKNYLFFGKIALISSFCLVLFIILFVNVFFTKNSITNTSKKADDMMRCEVVALANVINDTSFTQLSNAIISNKKIQRDEQEDIAYELKKYLLTGEVLLDKTIVDVNEEENNDQKYIEFKNKISFSLDDLNNFILYYNEDKIIKNRKKEESSIKGVLVLNNNDYIVSANREIEVNEYELEYKINIDKNKYIIVKKEVEKKENELKYEFYEENNCVKEVELESKNLKNNCKIELSIEENDREVSYDITKVKDGYSCKYSSDEVKDYIDIINSMEYYVFNFSDDTSIRLYKKKRIWE